MEESLKNSEESVLASNKSAVENLKKEKYDHAMFFLNQALLTSRSMNDCPTKFNLLAMTYNNLGCYLKRINKLKQALEYFLKASDLSRLYDSNLANLTCSHLNISKIYSEQGDHEKALRHGLKSLFLLRHNFAEKKSLISSLIIAYQTVGIEYQFLGQNSDSLECFESGLELSLRHLGKNHEVTIALQNSLKEANGKSVRSQSHQSRHRNNHHRGKSAGFAKKDSSIEIPNRPPMTANRKQKTSTKVFSSKIEDKILEYAKKKIKAVVLIQLWWKNLYKLKNKKKTEAAIKIQKWWRGTKARKLAEKIKFRNRISKRYVIRNSKQNPLIHQSFDSRKSFNEKEKKLLIGSTKLLQEINKPKEELRKKNTPKTKKDQKEKVFNSTEKTKTGKIDKNSKEMIKNSSFVMKNPGYETVFDNSSIFDQQNHKIGQSHKTPEKTKNSPNVKTLNKKRSSSKDLLSKNTENLRKSTPVFQSTSQSPQILINNSKPPLNPKNDPVFSIQKLPENANSNQLNTNKRSFLQIRRADISHQINSLIKIQSFVRMVPLRQKFKKMKKSCILIQKNFKRYHIRKLFQAIREAVIFIQIMYRKHHNKV